MSLPIRNAFAAVLPRSSRWPLAAVLVAAGALPVDLAAAEPAASRAAGPDELDAVLVTAERIGLGLDRNGGGGALGDRPLLDTPFSVTVIDAEDLARRQANSVGQIFINDPSVQSASPQGTTNWWGTQVRGIPVYNHYVDGVPLLLHWGGDFPLEAVQAVQVLKGLTGFMHGFGSPGGVISYETKRPTDMPTRTVELGYRNPGAVHAAVDVGGRLAQDGLGYRLNLAGEKGENYAAADVNRGLVSLALDHGIGERLTWRANALYERSKLRHEPLLFYWDVYEGESLPRVTYDYDDLVVDNSYYEARTLKTVTGLDWRIGDAWTADLSLGYSRKEHYSNKTFADLLNEAGDYNGYLYNFSGDLRNYFAQALLQGKAETGALRHDLVLGSGFQRSKGRWGNEWYWSSDFTGNLYQDQTFLVTRDIDFSFAPTSEDERQFALFASDTVHLGERWRLIGGVRFTDYETLDFDGDPAVDSGYRTNGFSPTAALVFKPLQQVSVYGSYVESLEAGSRVGETYANFGDILGATVSRQYEIGAKAELARLAFTAAAFRVERAAQIDEVRDGLRYLTQDGLTLYEGVEVIGDLAVTERLRLGFGATHLDARLRHMSEDNQELEGNRPAGAGRWQLVGNFSYRPSLIAGLSLHGTVRYFDSVYYEDANRVRIPDHTLVSAGFQYRTLLRGQRVTLTGNINNLLNRKYWEPNNVGEGINGALGVRLDW